MPPQRSCSARNPQRAVAQLPHHAQRPAPPEQVEQRHDRPAAARARARGRPGARRRQRAHSSLRASEIEAIRSLCCENRSTMDRSVMTASRQPPHRPAGAAIRPRPPRMLAAGCRRAARSSRCALFRTLAVPRAARRAACGRSEPGSSARARSWRRALREVMIAPHLRADGRRVRVGRARRRLRPGRSASRRAAALDRPRQPADAVLGRREAPVHAPRRRAAPHEHDLR